MPNSHSALHQTGIGARAEDLELVYELNKSWTPFPTYPLVLGLSAHSLRRQIMVPIILTIRAIQ